MRVPVRLLPRSPVTSGSSGFRVCQGVGLARRRHSDLEGTSFSITCAGHAHVRWALLALLVRFRESRLKSFLDLGFLLR